MEIAVGFSVLSLIVSVVSVILAYLVAVKYGDLAAVKATQKFHEEDVARARVAALQSLMNTVEQARKLEEYYMEMQKYHDARGEIGGGVVVPRFPVAAFEVAFVSGSSSLSASPELIAAVNDYLITANCINWQVDLFVAHGDDPASKFFGSGAPAGWKPPAGYVPEVLARLEDCLRQELEEARCSLR